MDFSHILSDSYTLALTSLLALSLVILCLYYGLFYFRVGHYKGPKKKKNASASQKVPPVSIVLTAQNDADWLKANLVYLLEQDYPDFEVVVVDYLSNDDTRYVLKLLADNYKHLKVVTFVENANGFPGMKYPFSIGIKSAKNDILLLADPQCMPKDLTQFSWIRQMVAGYLDKNTNIVLGYCGIQRKASLLNLLEHYDNLDYSTEYLGAALLHHPFTGNGRNLSYRRSFFLDKGGFIYHYYIPDGADDMFVNQNCTRRNTTVVLDDKSYTTVAPQPSFHQWHLYRKHRITTHAFHPLSTKLTRLIRPANVILFYLAALLLLFRGTFPWEILAAALAVKIIWQIIAASQATKRLDIKPVAHWLAPLLEIYFIIANTFLKIIPLSKK